VGNLDHSSFLDYILAVGSLERFTKLKHLRIPQKLLLGADEPTIIGDTRLPSHILSPCLETLEIDFPREAVFAFFDRLLQQRATFADIKDVVIHCATNERGLPFADGHGHGGMRKLWNRKPTVKQLCGADIKLFLNYNYNYNYNYTIALFTTTL
jgi:hypothetical protein